VDAKKLSEKSLLRSVNLKQNPLSKETYDALSSMKTSIIVHLSPLEKEDDWEKSECKD